MIGMKKPEWKNAELGVRHGESDPRMVILYAVGALLATLGLGIALLVRLFA
jgi:hypothetical protein